MYKLLPILLFAYSLAVTTEDIYDDSWAVIIGINEYEHVDKLNYAVQDAEAIKDLLISNFNFPKEHIIMLTDKEATLDNIRTKLFEVATSVNESDRLLVYYAGHGDTYNLKSGGERGYLIPVDGDLDNIFATCLPMSDIKEVASVTAAKHVLFLMDACYGGLLAVDARSISKTTSGYIDKITRDNARQIITAGGKGEQVIEKSEWGHSAFAKNLLHGLKTGIADEDSDGYITADELGSFLKKRVTIDSGNSQTPVKRRFGSDEGEFVFINNMYIENQTINLPSKTNNNFADVDELKQEIALLKEELSKPVKFTQGCTDGIAVNYNPNANLDDNSCIVLDVNDAYIRFGDFNSFDNTLEVYIKTGTGSDIISDINMTIGGFEIFEFNYGEVINNYNTREILSRNNIYFSSLEFNANDNEKLLFKAIVEPLKSEFCFEEVAIFGSKKFISHLGNCLINQINVRVFNEYNQSKLLENEIHFMGYDYTTEELAISINVNDSNLSFEGLEFTLYEAGIDTAQSVFFPSSHFNNPKLNELGESIIIIKFLHDAFLEYHKLCISDTYIHDTEGNYIEFNETCAQF